MLVQFNIPLMHWLLFLLEKCWNAFIIPLSQTDGCFFKMCLLELFSEDRINLSPVTPSFHAILSLSLCASLLQPQVPFRWEVSLEKVTDCYLNSFLLSLLSAAGLWMHPSVHPGQATRRYPDSPSKQFSHGQKIPRYTCDTEKQEIKSHGIIQHLISECWKLSRSRSIFSKDSVL